jgi:hypothetical protein
MRSVRSSASISSISMITSLRIPLSVKILTCGGVHRQPAPNILLEMPTKRNSHANADIRSALTVGRVGIITHAKLNFDYNMARSLTLFTYSKIFYELGNAQSVVCMSKSFPVVTTCAVPSAITSSAGYAWVITQMCTIVGGICLVVLNSRTLGVIGAAGSTYLLYYSFHL